MEGIDERLASGPREVSVDPGVINKRGFRAYLNTIQSIPNNADDKVEFDALTRDPFDEYDEATNYRYTPLKQGKYVVTATIRFEANISGIRGVRIYKNGVEYSGRDNKAISAGDEAPVGVSDIVEMNGTTDYLEIFAFQDSGSVKNLITGTEATFVSIQRIGD